MDDYKSLYPWIKYSIEYITGKYGTWISNPLQANGIDINFAIIDFAQSN